MSNPSADRTDRRDLLVADLDWLTPDLAVGGDLSHVEVDAIRQVRWLRSQGVTDIIDCRDEYSDESLVADIAPDIEYHHLPTDDHGGQINPDWWTRGVAEADRWSNAAARSSSIATWV